MIHVPVEPEYLAENGLHVTEKGLGKSAFLAYPVVASELGEGGSEVGRAKRDWGGGAGGIKATGGVGRGIG